MKIIEYFALFLTFVIFAYMMYGAFIIGTLAFPDVSKVVVSFVVILLTWGLTVITVMLGR